MKVLCFDTETTGLPISGVDPLDITQPWPCQLGAVLLENFEIVHSMNTLVRLPKAATFDPGAVNVHGITPALCRAEGKDIREVLNEFRDMAESADLITAYNLAFDDRIMHTTALRVDEGEYTDRPVIPKSAQKMCIMKKVEQQLKRPIRLSGAYYVYLRKKIEDAHDAFADTLAAAEILKAIVMQASKA
jgi:DNA polymerase-3 subunit alpha